MRSLFWTYENSFKRRNHQISRGIFMRIMGIVMGTNLAPILAIYVYIAMLKEKLCIICIRKNITWPEMFKIFINDGFGIIKKQQKIIF